MLRSVVWLLCTVAAAGPGAISPEEDAAGAVDGVINGGLGFHTSQDADPWWQVDLEGVHEIARVVVYNANSCPERASRLAILLSLDGKRWREAYRHDGTVFLGARDGKPLVVRLGGAKARWVRIRLPGSTWLHLDEVQVFGGGLEKENLARDRPATQSSTSRWSTRSGPPRTLSAFGLHLDRVRLALEDVAETHPERSRESRRLLRKLEAFEKELPAIRRALKRRTPAALQRIEEMRSFQREALLANPLLDFDKVVVLRRNLGARSRGAMGRELGVGTLNAHTNDTLPRTGWDNEIALLTDLRGKTKLQTVYKPAGGKIVADLEVDFDAAKILFSSVGEKQANWRIFEIDAGGGRPRQVTPDDGEDVGHFDSCYLPDGKIIFASTAAFQGLPCEFGGRQMACLYRLDPATGAIRQLTFEQDSNWCPTLANNGRVMYLRWEYSDLPHSNSRILFHMNPDGTGQMEYYGSGSYFPPSFFYARPVPGHPSKVVGIAGGHHGTPRSGRLLVVDPALGRREAAGVVQEIPGRGMEVEPIVRDRLVDGVWPQFLHPYPLSEKYHLVSMKPGPNSLWGIYLVDIFDNMTLIREVEGAALLEPIPLAARTAPPVVADRVDPKSREATVFLVDIYRGPGLAGIPRRTVKKLRLISYYFSPRGAGGLLGSIGMDGPWDIKRVLGTVPVEPDGSALFRIPANTPVSLQPLDEEGKALQLMRSWLVGMPGEVVSCVGCHESQNTATPNRQTLASARAPSRIKPWYGPVRGFSFEREVQPVLDRHCTGCHAELRGGKQITDWSSQIAGNAGKRGGGRFSASYAWLHRYVRRPGIESDLHMLAPGEYHADTTELVQTLRRGHHGVRLGGEAWDRLITWIDLNAPYHGNWSGIVGAGTVRDVARRRRELSRLYAGIDVDYEALPPLPRPVQPEIPAAARAPAATAMVKCPAWPFDAAEARRRQGPRESTAWRVDLGGGVQLSLVRIPAGEYVSGRLVRIAKPFWLSRFEITNEQFAMCDPSHDSRRESRHGYQFGRLGYAANEPGQPVVRVSWNEAVEFCSWLSRKTGRKFALPDEAQWEYACRAGAETPFYFGGLDTDFSPYANLGDARLREFAACTARGNYTRAEVIRNAGKYDDWVPKDARFDDGAFLSARVGSYKPNAWGLFDMHGNVWEWTATDRGGRKVVRGGSWYDRPRRCTATFKMDYRPYHKVFNVGFRVLCEAEPETLAAGGWRETVDSNKEDTR